jgi:hypothetical protein
VRALVAGAVALSLLSGVAVLVLTPRRIAGHGALESEEAQIQRVVVTFAAAADVDDEAQLVRLLCRDEAAALTEDDDYDPAAANDGGDAVPAQARTVVTVSAIQVAGDTATARVTRSTGGMVVLRFVMERGMWKVCSSTP